MKQTSSLADMPTHPGTMGFIEIAETLNPSS